MGSHSWCDVCPSCGYTGMQVCDDHGDMSSDCPICGYRTWTERNEPEPDVVELAKQLINELLPEDLDKALEKYYDCDYIPLVEIPELANKVRG